MVCPSTRVTPVQRAPNAVLVLESGSYILVYLGVNMFWISWQSGVGGPRVRPRDRFPAFVFAHGGSESGEAED